MKSFFNLNNKVILITGASGFIGKSVVKQLLIEECKLILILRNSNSFKKLNGLINKKNTFIYYADLNIESDLEAVLNDIKSKFNYIDGIINMSSDSSGLGSAKYKSNFSEFDNAFNKSTGLGYVLTGFGTGFNDLNVIGSGLN